ncbi:hypothetical protein IG195_19860 (plasmid) [Arthrobacter sp. TES]|nr:hypothetical protein ARZXY2_4497 [Arthrobacter sp. ZXY-2]QOI65648.1 hypothetical protein IG195_19860 [Arthrobacter sp. TES]
MISSTLLLLIGLVDLAGGCSRKVCIALRVLALLGVPALAFWGLGMNPISAGVCALAACGWIWVSTVPSSKLSARPHEEPRKAAPRLWPAIMLFLSVFGISAYDRGYEAASGFLVDMYSLANPGFTSLFPLEVSMAAVAVSVFLTRSANIVTQSALGWAKKEDTKAVIEDPAGEEPEGVQRENKWELFISSRKVASLRAGAKSEIGLKLKGGRLIGPIERLLIVVLAFAGAPQIIAGLAAAKGVVRFPEISEDRTSGSKAEEFLVGSLASWAMAAVAILYLTLVRSS